MKFRVLRYFLLCSAAAGFTAGFLASCGLTEDEIDIALSTSLANREIEKSKLERARKNITKFYFDQDGIYSIGEINEEGLPYSADNPYVDPGEDQAYGTSDDIQYPLIDVEVPIDTDLTALTPFVEINGKSDIYNWSPTGKQDWSSSSNTNRKIYSAIAIDGSKKDYYVKVVRTALTGMLVKKAPIKTVFMTADINTSNADALIRDGLEVSGSFGGGTSLKTLLPDTYTLTNNYSGSAPGTPQWLDFSSVADTNGDVEITVYSNDTPETRTSFKVRITNYPLSSISVALVSPPILIKKNSDPTADGLTTGKNLNDNTLWTGKIQINGILDDSTPINNIPLSAANYTLLSTDAGTQSVEVKINNKTALFNVIILPPVSITITTMPSVLNYTKYASAVDKTGLIFDLLYKYGSNSITVSGMTADKVIASFLAGGLASYAGRNAPVEILYGTVSEYYDVYIKDDKAEMFKCYVDKLAKNGVVSGTTWKLGDTASPASNPLLPYNVVFPGSIMNVGSGANWSISGFTLNTGTSEAVNIKLEVSPKIQSALLEGYSTSGNSATILIKLTAEDGDTRSVKNWTIILNRESSPVLAINSFFVNGQNCPIVSLNGEKYIRVDVMPGTAASSITPVIYVTSGAAVSPASGAAPFTAFDTSAFTTADPPSSYVTYTVTKDGVPGSAVYKAVLRAQVP